MSGADNESTNADTLRQLFVAALLRTTEAGRRVYSPEDWPIQQDQMPVVMVDSIRDVKTSRGRMGGIPQFMTVVTMEVNAYVQNASKVRAKAALNLLATQILGAVLTSNDIIVSIQQFTEVRSGYKITAEGAQHNGIGTLHFDMEFPQEFYPCPPTAPLEIVVIDADLASQFDATGTYTSANPDFDADFPDSALPAPRTIGPDGRLEGRIQINLPQD